MRSNSNNCKVVTIAQIRELKPTTTTATRTSQICIFDHEKTIVGTLSIDYARDDYDKLRREKTGSRTSFTAGKFASLARACCGRQTLVNKNSNEVY